jgi:tRNA G18 (ribose-2'-O)-methylase SpoU
MAIIRVHAIDDVRLAVYRDLPRRKVSRRSDLFVVEGRLLVERLLASACSVESVLVDESRQELLPPQLDVSTPVLVVDNGMTNRIIGFDFHRGILACGRRPPTPTGVDRLGTSGEQMLTVACSDVHDPINLGGILRSCAAFGVQAVVINRRCADPYSRRALRVSMGAVFRLPPIESANLKRDLLSLRDDFGFELVAAVLDDRAEPLERARRSARMALVFGNEGYGLDEDLVQLCQRQVTVGMDWGTDSLNAAVASGVFLYHFARVARAGSSETDPR